MQVVDQVWLITRLTISGILASYNRLAAGRVFHRGASRYTLSRLSSKNQITVPVALLREAGLAPGDEIQIRVSGPGRLELERVDDFVARWAGSLPPGTYSVHYLDELRDEWER